MSSIAREPDCPNLGGRGVGLMENVNGPCIFMKEHVGNCLPRGGHNPPTFLELMNASWANGWRPENDGDSAHADWLETGEGGSSWLRAQEDRQEARQQGLVKE